VQARSRLLQVIGWQVDTSHAVCVIVAHAGEASTSIYRVVVLRLISISDNGNQTSSIRNESSQTCMHCIMHIRVVYAVQSVNRETSASSATVVRPGCT